MTELEFESGPPFAPHRNFGGVGGREGGVDIAWHQGVGSRKTVGLKDFDGVAFPKYLAGEVASVNTSMRIGKEKWKWKTYRLSWTTSSGKFHLAPSRCNPIYHQKESISLYFKLWMSREKKVETNLESELSKLREEEKWQGRRGAGTDENRRDGAKE